MQGVVRFKREKNRTAQDVFNNMIRPRLPMAMDTVSQKMTHFNKNNHNYQNRSGALENSVSWMPAKEQGNKVVGALIAGGPSKAKYTYVQRLVFYHDGQGRLRVFEPSKPKIIRPGQPIDVNYAVFLEVKGYPVLKQGIEKYRHQFVAMASPILRSQKLPRLYTFKYTGETADIFGGS